MPEIDAWTRGDPRSGVGCLAADPGSAAFKDRLYAAWADGGPAKPYRIMASVSEDKGLTWSPSRVVSDLPDGGARADAYLPALAVSSAGVVGVTWYDTRDVPDGKVGTSASGHRSTAAGPGNRAPASPRWKPGWAPRTLPAIRRDWPRAKAGSFTPYGSTAAPKSARSGRRRSHSARIRPLFQFPVPMLLTGHIPKRKLPLRVAGL